MRPVRVDSRIPKGLTSLRKESIRLGLAELFRKIVSEKTLASPYNWHLHLHNAVVVADIQNLAAELMGQAGDGIQMLVLVAQSLAGRQITGVEFDLLDRVTPLRLRVSRGGDLAVVLEQFLEELRAEDGDLGEQELTLHEGRLGVVQDSPDGHEVIQLAAGLLDDAVLALQHDGHAGQILDLRVANHQTVDVEATSGKDSGDAGEHTGLVLHEAVQDVPLRRVGRRHGSLVQNRRDGGLCIPLGRGIGDGQGQRRTAVQCLVGQR